MCDSVTEDDNAQWLAVNRRQFAAMGAGAATLAMAPGCVAAAPDGLKTQSRKITITTADGTADGFFVAPAKGKHPAVLLWPDIAGLRPAYETMATRLAAAGFAVLAINHYYRNSPAPVLPDFAAWRTPEGQQKLQPMIQALNPDKIQADAGSYIDWLDRQAEVDTTRKIGTQGYCMGGPYTVFAAHARPARVGAAVSCHGANLVNDTAQSPHKLLAQTQASFIFAIAQNDDARSPGDKTALKDAAAAAGRPADVAVYPAQHGWCTIDAPVYDQAQAEIVWSKLLALYGKAL
jgi:carboxymethylenebutenolidase